MSLLIPQIIQTIFNVKLFQVLSMAFQGRCPDVKLILAPLQSPRQKKGNLRQTLAFPTLSTQVGWWDSTFLSRKLDIWLSFDSFTGKRGQGSSSLSCSVQYG